MPTNATTVQEEWKTTKTAEEWMVNMKTASDAWLHNQLHPCVRGKNGAAHDAAILRLIAERSAEGKVIERPRRAALVRPYIEEEEGVVEIVEYGGRGGTMRIVHSKSAC